MTDLGYIDIFLVWKSDRHHTSLFVKGSIQTK